MTATFQTGTSASSAASQDILTKLAAVATSKYVSAAAINVDGSGYVVGDILTITHASAYVPCKIEVLTVSGGGDILTFKIRSGGAFARRLASAVVNAGGTGYVVGNILDVTGGTFTEKAKVRVATLSGSAVATVTLFETGGAYTVDPSTTGCASSNDPGLGVGTGATFDLTMQAIVGSTNIAATGGTGTGATFDLTLTVGGWSSLRNWNNYSVNSVTNEKEVVLQGTAGGGNNPIVGVRTYTQTSGLDTRYGWAIAGMDSFNSGLGFASQVGVGPSTTIGAGGAICLLMFDNAQDYWFRVTPRIFAVTVKAVGLSVTTNQNGGGGLMNPFGTTTENPYPMVVWGSTRNANTAPDAGGFLVSGPTEVFAASAAGAPMSYRRASDGVYVSVLNSNNGTAASTSTMFPIGVPGEASGTSTSEDYLARAATMSIFGGISLVSGAVATVALMPTLTTNETELYPATICSYAASATDNDSETTVRGELDGIYWISATKSDGTAMVAEDTITDASGNRYRVFQNAHRTERYSYFALAEAIS